MISCTHRLLTLQKICSSCDVFPCEAGGGRLIWVDPFRPSPCKVFWECKALRHCKAAGGYLHGPKHPRRQVDGSPPMDGPDTQARWCAASSAAPHSALSASTARPRCSSATTAASAEPNPADGALVAVPAPGLAAAHPSTPRV